jgi:hypothetical protein
MLSPFGQSTDEFGLLTHLSVACAFANDRTSRTRLNALSAASTGFSLSPVNGKIGDDTRCASALGESPRVGAFDFGTDSHASATQHTAIPINQELWMRCINTIARIGVWHANRVHF